MKIRTFQIVEGSKHADLIDWRSIPATKKSDQKKSSHKASHQAVSAKKPKRGGISYNEEESE